MFQDILVTGLVNGGVYALLAIGFSLIFGVARIVNIAHTAFYMLAAYCFYALMVKVGLGFVVSALVAVGAVTAFSVICYRLVIEPVREHEAAVLIATIALALIFQELMLFSFGGHYLGIPSTLEGAVRVLGVSIPLQRLLILVVAAAMLAVVWFVLYRTRLGLAIRATANDLEVANLMGMNVNRVAMATVAISVALASVAGVVVAPVFVVDPFMWLAPLVTMLAIVVLGGLGPAGRLYRPGQLRPRAVLRRRRLHLGARFAQARRHSLGERFRRRRDGDPVRVFGRLPLPAAARLVSVARHPGVSADRARAAVRVSGFLRRRARHFRAAPADAERDRQLLRRGRFDAPRRVRPVEAGGLQVRPRAACDPRRRGGGARLRHQHAALQADRVRSLGRRSGLCGRAVRALPARRRPVHARSRPVVPGGDLGNLRRRRHDLRPGGRRLHPVSPHRVARQLQGLRRAAPADLRGDRAAGAAVHAARPRALAARQDRDAMPALQAKKYLLQKNLQIVWRRATGPGTRRAGSRRPSVSARCPAR